ncbi:MAG: hypothetical protein ACRYFR_11455 [Janthinobacterium lividum]
MPPQLHLPAPLAPVVESVARPAIAIARTPAEQAAKAAKAAKKERKHARLRWFFSWCWGCRAMGGSF